MAKIKLNLKEPKTKVPTKSNVYDKYVENYLYLCEEDFYMITKTVKLC